GVEVVRRLAGRTLPAGVRVGDFGIRGFDLAYALLDGYELVILVDATRRGGAPGSLYVLEPTLPDGGGPGPETHGMVPTRALQMARGMGAALERLLLVACEPESFGDPGVGRMGLSAPVGAAVDEATRLVDELVRRHLDLQPAGP
ncbi:MAG TPA: hydrogenase maturation protease, partial [Gemmatimonadales bacterium]|nr:hydrogenase maturation protease [Gemmatimonadales bacterium]